jgi:hypothetical protein
VLSKQRSCTSDLRDGHQCDGHRGRTRDLHGWRRDLDVFCEKGGSDYHVMRQQMHEAHTSMYGLCFAYIVKVKRVRLGYNMESDMVTTGTSNTNHSRRFYC